MTKPKSRLENADSIYKRTKPEKETAARIIDAVIRPVAGTSLESRLSVILPLEQVEFLDAICLSIKRNTRKKIKRTEVIRDLTGGLVGSGMDLTNYGTAEEIAVAVQVRL